MSRAWAKGSDSRWRKLRFQVLARDGNQCQLKLEGCTHIATCVHHTLGRGVTGDDPTHLVAACAHCNLKVGDPSQGAAADPAPRPRTRW